MEHASSPPKRKLDPEGFKMPITGVNNLNFDEDNQN
jgi:hypothetical protein